MATDCEGPIPPYGWQRCALPDFACIVMGQSPSSKTYNRSGDGLPFFQGKAEFGDLYPTINMYCSQPNKIAKRGATLLSVRAPVGPTNLAQRKCCIGRGLAALHPCGGIEPKFLLHLFRSIEPVISGKGTGSTFKAVTKAFVEGLEFNLPPLPEQHRIVAKIEELFSELDKGVESLKTARAQLKIYRQAVLKHAFEGKLTAQWRKENKDKLETPEQLLTRIKQERAARYEQLLKRWRAAVKAWEESGKSGKKPTRPKRPTKVVPIKGEQGEELPAISACWEWLNLKHIGRIETGTTPSTKISANYGGKLPFFKPTDLDQGAHVGTARYHLSQFGEESARVLPAGSTLVTCIGATIGKTGFAVTRCATNQQINSISPCAGFNSRFIYLQMVAPFLNGRIKTDASATTLPILNKSKFCELPFVLCSLPEQHELVRLVEERFTAMERSGREIDVALERAEALRQSILKKAFAGQLVAQDPTDEPASILLERIKAEREQATNKATSKTTEKRTVA